MFGVFLLLVGGGQEGIVSCMSRGGGFGLGVFRLLCFSGVLTPSLRGRAGERLHLLVQSYKIIS